jgi:hypothetical protein
MVGWRQARATMSEGTPQIPHRAPVLVALASFALLIVAVRTEGADGAWFMAALTIVLTLVASRGHRRPPR